jgi:hypothetical protein
MVIIYAWQENNVILVSETKIKSEITWFKLIFIRVAEYLTQLPPKELLPEKLHRAIEIARENEAKLIRLKTDLIKI